MPLSLYKQNSNEASPILRPTCPKCAALSGDLYLHCEPGAPFFPNDEEEARELSIEPIPMNGPVEVAAGPSMGPGELILEHAKRIGADQVGGYGPRKGP